MNQGDYTPHPIDTAHVAFPHDLEALVEHLSRNVHENWAIGRIAEGWRFGPRRDEDLKTHPSLVPYENLLESEKDYDRRSAVETLRVILALGYRLVPPSPSMVD